MPRFPAVRLTAAVVLVLGSALLWAPGASAAGPPLTLSATSIAVGESFTVSGASCENRTQPDNPPGVAVYSGANVAQTWSMYGRWSLTTSVGAQLGAGTFAVNAVCFKQDGNMEYATAYVTVVGPPAPAPQPTKAPLPTPVASTVTPTTSVPRTTGPATTASTPATTTTSTAPTSATAAKTVAASPTAAPAPGCSDCAKLTADQPVRAGQTLSLRYAGFQPGEQVTLVMRSTPVTLGTFTADATGLVIADVTIPTAAEAGSHTLTLTGPATGDLVVGFHLAAAEKREVATAPSAGTNLALPIAIGGAALVLLAAGVLIRRRRRGAPPVESDAQEAATPIAAPTA